MSEVTLHETLIITAPNVIKDTVFSAGPELSGKTMIYIPSSTTNRRLQGVRMKRVTLNCNGIAHTGLSAVDLYGSEFTDVQVIAPTNNGVYLAGETFAMQRVDFTRLGIWCNGKANGLLLQRDVINNANVSFCSFKGSYIHTEEGNSLQIDDCDTCVFENNGFETVTGYSIVCHERGANTWIGNDPGKGKVWFAHPEREYFVSWPGLNGAKVP